MASTHQGNGIHMHMLLTTHLAFIIYIAEAPDARITWAVCCTLHLDSIQQEHGWEEETA